MSSRFRASLLFFCAAALMLGACQREQRQSRGKPLGETVPAGESPDTIFPGGSNPPAPDPREAQYANNANAVAQGQMLYTQMNCVGCHSHGGGGMGPPLMDDEWRYGGSLGQIASTIAEGRPNGMPAWRGKLTDAQIWNLAAYVKSLSGTTPKDVVSSRPDAMSGPTPQSLAPHKPQSNSDVPEQ